MSEVKILAFGRVTEIIGKASFTLSDVSSTDQLKEKLEEAYPGLSGIDYAVAVDKNIVFYSTPLSENATVAILPPFSGG